MYLFIGIDPRIDPRIARITRIFANYLVWRNCIYGDSPFDFVNSAQDARGWEKVTSNRAQFIVFLGFLDNRYEIIESSLKVS